MSGLRPYQVEAVEAIVKKLADGGRAQMLKACGTGKTRASIAAAMRLVGDRGLVVVACPSLALVQQTLLEWVARVPEVLPLAVCGDESVADTLVQVQDLSCPVTRDSAFLAQWLTGPGPTALDQAPQQATLRLVLTTHLSADRVGEALLMAKQVADLLIVDEAHHTAGTAGKHVSLVHDDNRLPARRRLYMTATARTLTAGVKGDQDRSHPVLSMDDEDLFGQVAFSYPFSRAISEGWLDDYQIAVIGVSRTDVLDLIQRTDSDAATDPFAASIRTRVAQAALAQAATRWDLRRVITFCPRIADAREFAATMPATLDGLPAAQQPAGPLRAAHIEGGMSMRQREIVMDWLRNPPPQGWAMLANARCLTEGVDVPAVDGVLFTRPMKSTVSVIQAVGRALRRNPEGSGVSTVLVPILLPEDPSELDDVDPGEFMTLWQVLRALRAHDDTIAAELDAQRLKPRIEPALPSKVVISLPPGYDESTFTRYLSVRLIRHTTEPWWEGLGAARRYHARHGHLDLRVADTDEQDWPLGEWLAQQRNYRKRGWLSAERVATLDAVGMRWDVFHERFTANLANLTRFYERHGHTNLPQDTGSPEDPRLGQWLSNQRQKARQGTLAPARVTALHDVDPLWEQPYLSGNLAAAIAFHSREGHLRTPSQYSLGPWLTAQRRAHHDNTIHPYVRDTLTRLGIAWRLRRNTFERGLDALAAFRAREGHLRVPTDHVENGLDLFTWISNRRTEQRAGNLAAARKAALDALDFIWDVAEDNWSRGLAAATAFYQRERHLRPPKGHWEMGLQLSAWVTRQRRLGREGELTQAQRDALTAVGMSWTVTRGPSNATGPTTS
jgi:superfamily II DNA or RNA helicase